MRTLVLALFAAGLGVGSAQAQPLPGMGSDPFLEQRFRTEVQRLEADQRSTAATQFRFQGELASQRLENSVRNEVVVGPSPDETAPYRTTGARPQDIRRSEQLRQQRVERGLQQMRTPARR